MLVICKKSHDHLSLLLTFDPQAGHEQKGRRPAIVISNDLFQQNTGVAIVCPITSTDSSIRFTYTSTNLTSRASS